MKLTIIDRSRSGMIWMLAGAACAFGVSIFRISPDIGLALVVVALVRRRVDSYSQFAIGFILGVALHTALAISQVFNDPGPGIDGSDLR